VRVLVTRPEGDAERTAAALRRRGHDVLLAPMLRVELVADAEIGAGRWACVAMTSANAARSIAWHARMRALASLPVFTVGRQTAAAAREAGFTRVESADGDLHELARLLAARCKGLPGAVLYLAGEDRAGDLAGALGAHGLRVATCVIYRTVEVGTLPDEVRRALRAGALAAVLHFSRRSAQAFVRALADAGLVDKSLGMRHYCLSPQVREPLVAAGIQDIQVAAKPDEESLLALVGAQA
jgi:uroporphyrinogen-III synthase